MFVGYYWASNVSVRPTVITCTPPDQFHVDAQKLPEYRRQGVIQEQEEIVVHAANHEIPCGFLTYDIPYAEATKLGIIPNVDANGNPQKPDSMPRSFAHVEGMTQDDYRVLFVVVAVLTLFACMGIGSEYKIHIPRDIRREHVCWCV